MYTFLTASSSQIYWSNYTGMEINRTVGEPKTSPELVRSMLALANFRDTHVIVSGGIKPGKSQDVLYSVEIYSIESDSWQAGPNLEIARSEHCSVCLGDYVYVACGSGK